MTTAHEVGRRIRDARTRAGMSQQTLADLIDLSQARLSEIEAGKASKPPAAGLVFAIGVALRVDPTQIYDHPIVHRLSRIAWPVPPWPPSERDHRA